MKVTRASAAPRVGRPAIVSVRTGRAGRGARALRLRQQSLHLGELGGGLRLGGAQAVDLLLQGPDVRRRPGACLTRCDQND